MPAFSLVFHCVSQPDFSGRQIPVFYQVFSRLVFRTQNTRFLPGQGEETGIGFPGCDITKKGLESKGRGLKSRRFCDILLKLLVFSSPTGFDLVKTR